MKQRIARRSAKTNRRGAFTVEFAICSGLFFMILMTGIEFSRFMYARHAVDQAAYEAARRAILPGATTADAVDTATSILAATGIRNATIQVSPESITSSTETVTVTIRSNFADNTWMGPMFLGCAILDSSLTLDHENKAFLVKARNPGIGDNDHEPIDE
jgi:Flp pilus assembly protein TadG